MKTKSAQISRICDWRISRNGRKQMLTPENTESAAVDESHKQYYRSNCARDNPEKKFEDPTFLQANAKCASVT